MSGDQCLAESQSFRSISFPGFRWRWDIIDRVVGSVVVLGEIGDICLLDADVVEHEARCNNPGACFQLEGEYLTEARKSPLHLPKRPVDHVPRLGMRHVVAFIGDRVGSRTGVTRNRWLR